MALAERTGNRVDTALFITCVLLSLVALALPEGLRGPVASGLRRSVLFPLLRVEATTVRSAENRESVASLRAQRDSLAVLATGAPELARENARLRGLLQLGQRLVSGYVAGEVLHQSGVSDGLTLLISVGARDGVEPLAPVVTPEGLLGMIRAVDRRTSVALAWTHPDFRVSAMAEGAAVFGIVAARRGEAAGEVLELRGVPYRDVLRPGTRVVTSGLGSVFPRGVPIGTIEGVLSESAGWERTYLLRPAVHPADAVHVMILRRARAGDTLTTVFADTTVRADTTGADRVAPRP